MFKCTLGWQKRILGAPSSYEWKVVHWMWPCCAGCIPNVGWYMFLVLSSGCKHRVLCKHAIHHT